MRRLLVLTLAVASCTASPAPVYDPATFRAEVSRLIGSRQYGDAIALLEVADPVVQARFDRMGFAAVGEDLIVLPGAGRNVEYDRIRDWFIPGTSDSIEDMAWQQAATKFAESYNRARLAESLDPGD